MDLSKIDTRTLFREIDSRYARAVLVVQGTTNDPNSNLLDVHTTEELEMPYAVGMLHSAAYILMGALLGGTTTPTDPWD